MIFEDEHLLAVNKPAGWNTHAPAPYAGEGIYDWLKAREPRWASLAIIHRLDKETSGVLLFGKTPVANRSLTEQFTAHRIRKQYLLLTDRNAPRQIMTAQSALLRIGEKYASRLGGEPAETRFVPLEDTKLAVPAAGLKIVRAEPLTGRTHQIRVHAAENGFPIFGDTLYGGTTAARVFLHASEIAFTHPATGAAMVLSAPVNFVADSRQALRQAFIEPDTNAFRLVHGASDGWPGWYVDRLGDYLLSQAETPLTAAQLAELVRWTAQFSLQGAYHKLLSRQVRRSSTAEASPQLVCGVAAPACFEILENGLRFEMSFQEGYSVGLFLDQRDNRRRLLHGADTLFPPAAAEVLNIFAYTCGFSVCAAKAGARTTSLDLSKKYLDWGRRNFILNGLDPIQHDFIYGDAFDWLRRLAKKGRKFDVIVLDPPTFSQSKESGVFRVERNLGDLVAAAGKVLKPGGWLLACANAADWPADHFVDTLKTTVHGLGQPIKNQCYVPQPPDFPVTRAEPAYLKTAWLKSK